MCGSHLGEHQAVGGRDGVVVAGAGRSDPSAHPGHVAGRAGHHGRDRGDFSDFADRGDAPFGGVGGGRTDRQPQAGRGRRHCLNAVPLERLRRRWAGPVEGGFASGLLRILRRAERWRASRSGRSEGVGGDQVGRGCGGRVLGPQSLRSTPRTAARCWGCCHQRSSWSWLKARSSPFITFSQMRETKRGERHAGGLHRHSDWRE